LQYDGNGETRHKEHNNGISDIIDASLRTKNVVGGGNSNGYNVTRK